MITTITLVSTSISNHFNHFIETTFEEATGTFRVMFREDGFPTGDGVIITETSSMGVAAKVHEQVIKVEKANFYSQKRSDIKEEMNDLLVS